MKKQNKVSVAHLFNAAKSALDIHKLYIQNLVIASLIYYFQLTHRTQRLENIFEQYDDAQQSADPHILDLDEKTENNMKGISSLQLS